MSKLFFIGAGKMASAIAGGIVLGLEWMAREYPEHITFQRLGTG